MGLLRLFAEAFGIFALSIIALFGIYKITDKRATGVGWVHWKGYVLMGVGALYFVFGAIFMRLK